MRQRNQDAENIGAFIFTVGGKATCREFMMIKQLIKSALPEAAIWRIKKLIAAHTKKCMLHKLAAIAPYERGRYPQGINLIGDIKAETGLGQSMRILADIFEDNEIPFCIKQVNAPGNLQRIENKWDSKMQTDVTYGMNLIHINPSVWGENYNKFPPDMLNYRYNIAYWAWELEEFPKEWMACIDTVDEIWTPSEFVSRSIRAKTDKPVVTVPYTIKIDRSVLYDRKYFSLPENKFLFIIMYDFMSVSERKNPWGGIEAYKKAFGNKNESVGLIIKVNHLPNEKELYRLKKELQHFPNIYYITKNYARKEVESLVAVADVLVSLHRSEGFGLQMAEAMYLGTPVIATNWSATTEFMSKESACLVDYELIALAKNIGPYKRGSYWADADISQAADYMRRLYSDREFYQKVREKAECYIKSTLNGGKCGAIIKQRMQLCGHAGNYTNTGK